MKSVYKTNGTCSTQIELEVVDGIIKDVKFTDGCNGNLSGIAILVKGMKASEVIEKFEGTRCGDNPTSCPDQLAKALKEIIA